MNIKTKTLKNWIEKLIDCDYELKTLKEIVQFYEQNRGKKCYHWNAEGEAFWSWEPDPKDAENKGIIIDENINIELLLDMTNYAPHYF
jgi:hypothetical protein